MPYAEYAVRATPTSVPGIALQTRKNGYYMTQCVAATTVAVRRSPGRSIPKSVTESPYHIRSFVGPTSVLDSP
eukprot:3136615-Rhodomonas_salina.2